MLGNRLSEAFYDRFGDEIVAELVEWFNLIDSTYRGELREINEINFARFEAKLEQRILESELRLERRLATKADLAAFATKADLAALATKIDILEHATKDALKTFVTKEQAEGLATKVQLSELSATLERALKDQLRYMFGVWSVLALMIVGLYFR